MQNSVQMFSCSLVDSEVKSPKIFKKRLPWQELSNVGQKVLPQVFSKTNMSRKFGENPIRHLVFRESNIETIEKNLKN